MFREQSQNRPETRGIGRFRVRSAGVAAVVALVTLLTVSCTRYVDAEPVAAEPVAADDRPAASDASPCTPVDPPLTAIPARADGEPVLRIPQPDGWERSRQLDSGLIRFVIGNPGIVAEEFVPNVVVTLETVDGVDPGLAFEQQRLGLEQVVGATDLRVSAHTLCGLPAQTIDYLTPAMGAVRPHPATVLLVALDTDDEMYIVAVTAQTMDPDNPTYRRDVDAILSGFLVLPPSPE